MAKKKIPESPADLPSTISSYEKESREAESKLRDGKPKGKPKREDFSQSAARIVREATEEH